MNMPLFYHCSGYIVTYTQDLSEQWNVRLKDCSKCSVKSRNLQKKVVPTCRKAVNF